MKIIVWLISCLLAVEAQATTINYPTKVNIADYLDEIENIGKFEGRYTNFHGDMLGAMPLGVEAQHKEKRIKECEADRSKTVSNHELEIPAYYRRFVTNAENKWNGEPIDPRSSEGRDIMAMCEYSIYYKECDQHEPQEILRSILDYGFFTERDASWVRYKKCEKYALDQPFARGTGMDYLYYYYNKKLKPQLTKRKERIKSTSKKNERRAKQ